MSIFEQMKNKKDRIEKLLECNPKLRDCDYKLIATYMYHEVGKDKLIKMSGFDLLTMLSKGELTNTETIRRVRAKIQEDRKDLRGDSYKKRGEDGDDISNRIEREL